MDRITSMVVFGEVAKAGSFSAAARQLRLSQAAVSKHVQALEDWLGAPQTAHFVSNVGRLVSIDFFAIARISGDMTGSAIGFFFITAFTIKHFE